MKLKRFKQNTVTTKNNTTQAAIHTNGLSISLSGNTILRNVNFSIQEGELAVIIGPNGSGKSTLVKALLGLVPHAQGEISIFGTPLTSLPREERKRIGYVAQRFHVDRSFPITVQEFISLMFYDRATSTKEQKRIITQVLKDVDASHLKEKKLGVLSGGELQRVLIARALARTPRILFLDEPASGIDVGGEETLWQLIDELRARRSITIVMVSHDLNVVTKYADNVICINKRLICYGSPKEILTSSTLSQLYGDGIKIYQHTHHHDQHDEGENNA